MWRQEHLSEVPNLCVFIMPHISLTPYSFEFHKGSDVSCCGVKHTSYQFQVLTMQRQPTPRLVQKLNWRRWPNGFAVAIFSLATSIYWARYCCRSNWHKTWSYHSFISIKNIELCGGFLQWAGWCDDGGGDMWWDGTYTLWGRWLWVRSHAFKWLERVSNKVPTNLFFLRAIICLGALTTAARRYSMFG